MNVREKTWQLLCEICLDKQYSNLLLRHQLQDLQISDRAWITQVVYGTLQNYRYVRYMWEDLVKKAPDEKTCILLDMSVYQLFYMDKVPAYAVVNEAVDIVKKHRKSYANLVNAVLQNVIRRGKRKVSGTDDEVLAITTSHPLWLIKMWNAQYGNDVCQKICHYNMKTQGPMARVNTLKTTKETLLKADSGFTQGTLCEDALRYHGGNLAATSFYQNGEIAIQDEASQMVAIWLDAKPGECILDVCSAPGTKTTHIAQCMKNEGSIIAGDIHKHRVKLIEESAKRLGITIIQPIMMDATKLQEVETCIFDRILCDVPCSGYGVLGRKSDIKYHMQSNDMDTLIPLQQAILEKASEKLKAGGILVYSTCTLNKKENEKQIEQFLKSHGEFQLVCEQTIFPYKYDCDGFYMAKLIRLS